MCGVMGVVGTTSIAMLTPSWAGLAATAQAHGGSYECGVLTASSSGGHLAVVAVTLCAG
jgi:hypothetical protein